MLGDQFNAIKCLIAKRAVVLIASGDGECQRIKDEVVLIKSPLAREQVVNARCNFKLSLRCFGHSRLRVLIYCQRHARGAVALEQRTHRVHASFAILQIYGVHNAAARGSFQTGLKHGRLRAIKHERRVYLSHHARNKFAHVGHAVAAHKVNAHIKKVAAVFHFFARHSNELVPLLLIKQALELAAAVGVGAFGNN